MRFAALLAVILLFALSVGVANEPGAEAATSADVQALIDALPAEGGVVELPAGQIDLNEAVEFTHGVTLRGQGRETTFLVGNLEGPLLTRQTNNAIHVVLEDFTVDNTSVSNVGGVGVDFTNVYLSRIDVRIRNVETGILIQSVNGQPSYYNRIVQPDINITRVGIHLGFAANVTQVEGGRIDAANNDPGDAAILIDDATAITITGTAFGAYAKCVQFMDGSAVTVSGAYFENQVTNGIGVSYEGVALDLMLLNPYFALTGAGAKHVSNTSFQKEKLYMMGNLTFDGPGINMGRIGAIRETRRYTMAWTVPPIAPGGAVSTELNLTDVFQNNIIIGTLNRNTGGAAALLPPVVTQPGKVRVVIANYSGSVVNLGPTDITLLVLK
jgi:hypothetical protein